MIEIIEGNLLESGADIICHQVNCQGKMNSGVAKQIRLRWPNVFEEYVEECKTVQNTSELLGRVQQIEVGSEIKYVMNLFAQDNYGYDGEQYTSTEALRKCFERITELVKIMEESNNQEKVRIAMPYKIGCVRGGADWDEVYAIIEEIFRDFDVELWKHDMG